MSAPPFDLRNALSEFRAAKTAQAANPEPPLAGLAALAGGHRESEISIEPSSKKAGSASRDWRDYFEERAAIREFDGRLSRSDAEAGALADCAARWRALNPLPDSGLEKCAHCGEPRPDTPVLARGGHSWIHQSCWPAMNAALGAAATAAVKTLLETEDFDQQQVTSTFGEI